MALTNCLTRPGKNKRGGITWRTMAKRPQHSVYGSFKGSQKEEQQRQFYPTEIPHVHKFRPIVIMFIGRRGKGKSLAMTALAHVQQQRYDEYHRRHPDRAEFGIAANYRVNFAEVVSPYLVDDLMQFPDWGYRKNILVDEAAANFPSRRSMSGNNITFSNFITQIRKRDCEMSFTTQFPQNMDSQVLQQVDLFIRCSTYNGDRSVTLQVFDYWGQWTGKDFRKPWPPQSGYEDWTMRLHNLDTIWPLFNTNEVQAPLWSSQRDRIIGQGWHFDSDDEMPEEDYTPPTPPANLAELIDRVVGPINVTSLLTSARIHEPLITRSELAGLLGAAGFTINKRGSQYYADKQADPDPEQ